MIFRSFLAGLVSLSMISQPVYADSYIFRYKSGEMAYGPIDPEPPINENDYDITASFIAFAGEQSSFQIPLKPGKTATSWIMRSGGAPRGLTLNADTGVIEGVATGRGRSTMSLLGLSSDGADASKVNVDITVVERDPTSKEVTVYAHSDRFFEQAIAAPGEAYSWEPVMPLPSWARMSGMNVVGTPPAGLEGVFSFAMQGKDFTGKNSKLVYGKLVVNVGPVIGFIEDRFVEPNKYFSLSAAATNKVGKLKWKPEGDVLPANLSFSTEYGRITGSIATFDTSARIRMVAFDTDGTIGYSNYFTISTRSPDLDINNVQDRDLFVGTFSTMRLYAKEVDSTPTWRIEQGELPEGMTLDATAGTISGTPVKAEVKEGIILNVSTNKGYSASSNEFKMTVREKPLKVANVAQTHVRIGKTFSTPAPVVSDGRAPYKFQLAEGQAAVDGATLNAETGVISGSFTIAGTKNTALQVKDANGTTSSPFVVGVAAYNPLKIIIDPSEIGLTRLQSDATIAPKFDENTLIPNERASLADFRLTGTLPDGLTFNPATGDITGKAKANGFYGPLSMQVTDGSGDRATSNSFSIRVAEKEPLSIEVVRDTFAVFGTYSSPFVKAISPAGNVTFSLKSGVLPAGMTLSPDGSITGKPTTEGRYPGVVISATDEEGAVAETEPFDVTVTPPEALAIVSKDIHWAVGRPMTASLEAKNFSQSVTYVVTSGSLPAGVSLNADGKFFGQASAPTEVTITVTATDSLNRTATKAMKLKFTAAMTLTLNVSYDLPLLAVTNITPETTNAVGSVSFSITGSLPEGLTFNPTSGSINGKPSKLGETQNITVAAVDTAGTRATATTKLTVTERQPLKIAYNFTNPLTENSASGLPKRPLEPTYAVGEVVYSVAGMLPDGLTLNAKDGSFVGTPRKIGVFEGIVVSGRDADGTTVSSDPLRIVVAPSQQLTVANQTVSGRVGTLMQTETPVVKGAVGAVTYSTTTPTPLGLTFSTTYGVFTGVPSATGGQVVAVEATDAVGRKATFRITLKVVDELKVTYENTATSQYAPLSIQPVVENAIDGVTFAVASGSMGSLTLNSNTGEITGSPSTVGTLTFSIRATDEGTANNTFTTGNITITVGQRLPLEITMAADQNVLVNQKFSQKAAAKNAVGAVTWTVISGNLPTGLSLENGTIAGIPTELGFFSATFSAVDSAGGSATQVVNYVVTTNGLPISLTTYSVQTKSGMAFVSQLPLVKNAVGDYSFYSDDLANQGIRLDPVTGEIAGKFDSPVRVTGNIHVTDSTNRVTSKPITVEVIPNLVLTMREQINITASATMIAVRPSVEYAIGTMRYELVGPALPAGLLFNKTSGAISGTPTILGKFNGYFIEGVDGLGDRATTNEFSIVIYPSGTLPTITMSANYDLVGNGSQQYTITPTVNPKKVDDVYSLNKPLPNNMELNSSTGVISGTVSSSSVGLYEGYELSLTDTAGNISVSNQFNLRVRSDPEPTFAYDPVNVRAGMPFEGTAPRLVRGQIVGDVKFEYYSNVYSYLKIDSATGIVSGTIPSNLSPRQLSATVRVADSIRTYSQVANITVNVIGLSVKSGQTTYAGVAGQHIETSPLIVEHNVGSVRFAWAEGSEVAGLTVNPDTGVISGVLPFGTFTSRKIVATDDIGSASVNVSFSATNPPAVFSFSDQNVDNAELGQTYETLPVRISGILGQETVKFSGSNTAFFYRMCDTEVCDSSVAWRTGSLSTATVSAGQYIQLQRKVAAKPNTEEFVSVTINGTNSVWTTKTRGALDVPSVFSFGPDYDGLEVGEIGTSNIVKLVGFQDTARLRLDLKNTAVRNQGYYRVCKTPDCSDATWKEIITNMPSGTYVRFDANPGDYIQVYALAGPHGQTRTITVSLPDYGNDEIAAFSVTSRSAETRPDPVDFGPMVESFTTGEQHNSRIVQITGNREDATIKLASADGSPTISRMFYRVCSMDTCTSPTTFANIGHANGAGQRFQLVTVKAGQYLQLGIKAGDFDELRELVVTLPDHNDAEIGRFAVKMRSQMSRPDNVDLGSLVLAPTKLTQYNSNIVQIRGNVDPANIKISAPDGSKTYLVLFYKLCSNETCSGGGFVNVGNASTMNYSILNVKAGQYLQVGIKAGELSELRELVLTLPDHGDVEIGRFAVKTRDESSRPDAVDFGPSYENVERTKQFYSSPVQVKGTLDNAKVKLSAADGGPTYGRMYVKTCSTELACTGPQTMSNIGNGTGQAFSILDLTPGQYLELSIKAGEFGEVREVVATLPDHGDVEIGRFKVTTRLEFSKPNPIDFGLGHINVDPDKNYYSDGGAITGTLDPARIELSALDGGPTYNFMFVRTCSTAAQCSGTGTMGSIGTAGGVKSTIITAQPGTGIQLMIKSGGLGVSRTIVATLPDHGNVEVGRFTVKSRD